MNRWGTALMKSRNPPGRLPDHAGWKHVCIQYRRHTVALIRIQSIR
jgi:hypothetical protein